MFPIQLKLTVSSSTSSFFVFFIAFCFRHFSRAFNNKIKIVSLISFFFFLTWTVCCSKISFYYIFSFFFFMYTNKCGVRLTHLPMPDMIWAWHFYFVLLLSCFFLLLLVFILLLLLWLKRTHSLANRKCSIDRSCFFFVYWHLRETLFFYVCFRRRRITKLSQNEFLIVGCFIFASFIFSPHCSNVI